MPIRYLMLKFLIGDCGEGHVIRPRQVERNARLVLQSATQHLLDDPALLAVQISRRLPLPIRVLAGRLAVVAGGRVPGGEGVAALGAFIAGDERRAAELLERYRGSRSRTHGEVAVLLGRPDLLSSSAPASTHARAAWARGDLSGAVQILVRARKSGSAQARRLASELRLLGEGYRLPVSASCADQPVPAERGPLRVLHLLTNSLPHTQSGYSLRSHNILTALRDYGIDSIALTRAGYPVMVGKLLCAEEDVVDGIRYRRVLPPWLGPMPEDRLQQEVREALRLVEQFRPHVLHATTDYRNALVADAVSRATGIPWVLEVRGLMDQTWIASHRRQETRERAAASEKVRLIRATESDLARSADAVLTLSRTMADELVQRGVPAEGITLVPNCVDASLLAEDISPQEARARISAPVPGDALVIGAVSALVDYEGFDVLLRAAARIIDDPRSAPAVRERLHVVVVGDGAAAPSLAELARELGIQDRVHLPGRVPRSDARYWVQALDVVVIPRRDLEVSRMVTPQKPAEALALGRPVVVSDLPALKETISDAHGNMHGALFRPDDPQALAEVLTGLFDDSDRRVALATSGRATASDRTWPAMMTRYERVYRTVAAQAGKEISSAE